MPVIDVTVVRENCGDIRCIYVGSRRVMGQKPYVSENLPQEIYQVPLKMIEDVLALAFDTTNDTLFEGMQIAVEAALREDVDDPSLAVTRAVFAFLQAHFSQAHGLQKEGG